MVNEGPVDPDHLRRALGIRSELDAKEVHAAIGELAARDMMLLDTIGQLGQLGTEQNKVLGSMNEALSVVSVRQGGLKEAMDGQRAAAGFWGMLTLVNLAGMLYLLLR